MGTSETTIPRILVTGCSGLIGSRVIERLRDEFAIVGFDVEPVGDDLAEHVDWIRCDLTEDDSVSHAIKNMRDQFGDHLASVIHLALYQWKLIDSAWDPVFGKQTRNVLDSKVAARMDSWIGVPDAALGALAYLGDAIFGLAGSTRRWQYRPWLVILFGIDVIP